MDDPEQVEMWKWEMEEREMRDDTALQKCVRYDINTFSDEQEFLQNLAIAEKSVTI